MLGIKKLRLKVKINAHGEFNDFTGKIVKSFLICVNPKLKEIFEVEGGYKEIHVSPLLDEEGKAIYPRKVVKCSFCVDKKPKGKGSVILPKVASFEVSGPEELLLPLYDFHSCTLEFGKKRIEVVTLGVEEVEVNVEKGSSLYIKFRGPAILRDPWHKPGEEFRSRFLPSPSHLFSTNVYFFYGLTEEYYNALFLLERALVEDHSSLNSLGKVWYYYGGRWLPALTGTLLFWVREWNEVIENVLLHAAYFGVGSGRAAGFGDVILDLA